MTEERRLCEQGCGRIATVYAGGPFAGDWAGYYCVDCVPHGFSVWHELGEEGWK